MRPLDFDFAERRGPGLAGWLVLAAALLFAADLARSYLPLRDEIARIEGRVAKSAPGQRAARAEAGSVNPEEFSAARAVVGRFSAPWPALFDAIEAVRMDEIALLAIEPDAASGQVLISGEGRSYVAVLTYVSRLEAQPGLTRVHLARHEVRETEPRRPVAFSVAARWRQP
jgi:hypothetical protein